MKFPSNITFIQMIKAFNFKFGYCKNDNLILEPYNEDNNKILKKIFIEQFNNFVRYKEYDFLNFAIYYGKIINVENKNIKNPSQPKMILLFGQLDSNKSFVKKIQVFSSQTVKKIIYDNKILNIKDEMSLKSLGIKNASVCFVEFQ